MTEIVRMTSQMRPLEMGVPLYPFSHSGVFPINKGDAPASTSAPLPDSSSFEDHPSVASSPTSLRGVIGSPSMSLPMSAARTAPPVDSWQPRLSASGGSGYMQNISQRHHRYAS